MDNKYVASYGLTNNSAVGIKEIVYGCDDVVEWDLVTDKVIESGESIIEYTDEGSTFKVGEMDIPLNECMRGN